MSRRAAVLISGSGSNLQALIDAEHAGGLAGTIALVVSNRSDAYGLSRARRAGIETCVLPHEEYSSRKAFDGALAEVLDAAGVDLVLLAGFMRILTPEFVTRFGSCMLNIHPSLLPAYRGLRTHERALADGVKEHGCTVHFVVPELDAGPSVIQGVVRVCDDDTPASLAERVHHLEHRVYPRAARWFLEGRLALRDGVAWLDGEPLRTPLIVNEDEQA